MPRINEVLVNTKSILILKDQGDIGHHTTFTICEKDTGKSVTLNLIEFDETLKNLFNKCTDAADKNGPAEDRR